MSLLLKNAMPAERMRGCVFAERFHSVSDVVANGGVVTGTPTFSIDKGVELDGVGDRITYAIQPHILDSTNISLVCDFWPAFTADADVKAYIYDTTNGSRFYAYHLDDASSNALWISVGEATISVPYATYGAYWLANQRNVLAVSSTSGATDAWLNGTKIIDADATAWTMASPPTDIYVGSRLGGALSPFEGSVSSLKFFNTLLTEQEAVDYYNNTTFDWRNRMLIDLPMLMADHDPVNGKTLNRGSGGSSNDGSFGAGVATPTKLTHSRGYSFDGGDYIDIATTGMDIDTADFAVWMRLALGTAVNTTKYFCTTTALGITVVYNYTLGQLLCYNGMDGIVYSSFGVGGQDHTVIFTRVGGIDYLYVDGVLVDTDATASGSVAASDHWYIAATVAALADFDGEVYQFGASDTLGLTGIQAADCHLQMMKGVNVL
jgi:hypothetical protein